MRAIADSFSMWLPFDPARLSWSVALLCIAWSGCTPFKETRRSQTMDDAGADAALADAETDAALPAIDGATPAMPPAPTTNKTVNPPQIITDCVGHEPGELFCVAEVMHVCKDVRSEVVPCGRRERCIVVDDQAVCACVPGSVDTGSGCQEATSCDSNAGGCDPLTECSMSGNRLTCSACPPGYDGDGNTGCTPLLLALEPSCGEIVSGPTGEANEYALRAPTLCQRVGLELTVPPKTKVKIDGAEVATDVEWLSAPLPVGATAFQISLTGENGVNRAYRVNVERDAKQDAYIKATNASADDCFGFNVSASGATLAVGAPYESGSSGGVNGDQANSGAAKSGAAYVYVRQGNGWVQQAYVKADAPSAEDFFGTAVAVDGDTLVVGAPRQDPLFFSTFTPTRPGAAYVYVRENGVWSFDQKLLPKQAASGDLFGFKVAVSGDTVLVSAPFDDTAAARSGAVYVFRRSGGEWTESQKFKASQPVDNAAFGFAIAIDRETALIGASQDPTGGVEAGSAYVFVRRDGMFHEQSRLRPERPSARMVFGWQVALHGDIAVIGAPAVDLVRATGIAGSAFVFRRVQDQWQPAAALEAPASRADDYFGSGVSVWDETVLITGNGTSTDTGAAYLYVRNGESWVRTTSLQSANLERGDAFGQVGAVTGEAVLISAPFEDSAATGVNGNGSSNAAANSGAVYVYR